MEFVPRLCKLSGSNGSLQGELELSTVFRRRVLNPTYQAVVFVMSNTPRVHSAVVMFLMK